MSILLLGGNTITSLEMDTAAVSKGKRTALVPTGCMLPLLSAVICHGILVLLLWSFLLISELLKQKLMPALETSAWYRDRTEVPDYIPKIWMAFFNQKVSSQLAELLMQPQMQEVHWVAVYGFFFSLISSGSSKK